jgi:hypothetical protein
MTTPPPKRPGQDGGRGDLSLQVLSLAAELAAVRAQLAALGDLARVPGEVEELRDRITTITEVVTGILAKAQQDAASGSTPATAICWPDMDSSARADALGLVRDWLHDVLFVWHPSAQRVMRACWYRHRDALSDTAALYEVWCWAYRADEAPPGRREEWHASWLPDWLDRMKNSPMRACVDGHDGRAPAAPMGPEWARGFDEYAAWFADPQGRPEPDAPGGGRR